MKSSLNLITLTILFISLTACLKNGNSSGVKLTSKQALGQKLFMDPRLSVDGTISCNSCHNVMNAGVDSRQFSMGVNGALGGRNSPTVFNAKFLSTQFWDGRAKSLADQAKGPLTNPVEMGNVDHAEVMRRLNEIPGYVSEFKKVFGENSMKIDNLAEAIASYEETLITLNSPFDQNKMSDLQKIGYETFKSTGCTACHSGDHFAGPELPIGQGFFQKFPTIPNTDYDKKYKFSNDLGRFAESNNPADKNMFRVPTLRNIALTAPYFHNGAVKELSEAVRVMGKTQLNKNLSQQEVNEIVAFLNALSGTIPTQVMPVLPPTPGKSVAEIK